MIADAGTIRAGDWREFSIRRCNRRRSKPLSGLVRHLGQQGAGAGDKSVGDWVTLPRTVRLGIAEPYTTPPQRRAAAKPRRLAGHVYPDADSTSALKDREHEVPFVGRDVIRLPTS